MTEVFCVHKVPKLRQFRELDDTGPIWASSVILGSSQTEPGDVEYVLLLLDQGLGSQRARLHTSPAYKLCANSTFLSPFCLNVSSMTSASKAAPCPNLSSCIMTSRP